MYATLIANVIDLIEIDWEVEISPTLIINIFKKSLCVHIC